MARNGKSRLSAQESQLIEHNFLDVEIDVLKDVVLDTSELFSPRRSEFTPHWLQESNLDVSDVQRQKEYPLFMEKRIKAYQG